MTILEFNVFRETFLSGADWSLFIYVNGFLMKFQHSFFKYASTVNVNLEEDLSASPFLLY